MVPFEALHSVIADMAERADNGDEAAAVQLNMVADTCPPAWLKGAAERLAQVPAPLFSPSPPPLELSGDIPPNIVDEWDVIGCAVDLIAEHYGLPSGDVWGAVFEIETEVAEDTGLDRFGNLLEAPQGFAALGLRVAQKLLGFDAASRPLLYLGVQ